MSYFYGPVPSRRLGFSLGVDLLPKKSCSFDCLYCQLGSSKDKKVKRFYHVDIAEFRSQLRQKIKENPRIDYITISGSGEPTLHKSIDKIIALIRKITDNKYPVCVITNSSLLYRKQVRKELLSADLIIPSLDAALPQTFGRLNRPHRGITLSKIIDGIIKFRREFKGKIWLEIMLVAGINDTIVEIAKFKEIIDKIKPDKIQLNTPTRPSLEKFSAPSLEKLKRIAGILGYGAEIVSGRKDLKSQKAFFPDIKKNIFEFLKRRPAGIKDLEKSFPGCSKEISEAINSLVAEGRISMKGSHFTAND